MCLTSSAYSFIYLNYQRPSTRHQWPAIIKAISILNIYLNTCSFPVSVLLLYIASISSQCWEWRENISCPMPQSPEKCKIGCKYSYFEFYSLPTQESTQKHLKSITTQEILIYMTARDKIDIFFRNIHSDEFHNQAHLWERRMYLKLRTSASCRVACSVNTV